MQRRKFIKNGGLAAGGLVFGSFHLSPDNLLSPLKAGRPVHNIPVDKGLDPSWIKSLYEKGNATAYRKSKNELKYIGMPAGGLHTGTVYMGGDGRLWLWSIYNDEREGVIPNEVMWNDGEHERKIQSSAGANYVSPTPADNNRPLEQGIAVEIVYGGKTVIRELKESDWEEVIFEATYPLATVVYRDKHLPFDVRLVGGGIFIPTNAADSAMPLTVLQVEVVNRSGQPARVSVLAWMENGARKVSAKNDEGFKRNSRLSGKGYAGVYGDFEWSRTATAQRDDGSTAIAMMGRDVIINTGFGQWPEIAKASFDLQKSEVDRAEATDKQVGSVMSRQDVLPGKRLETKILIAWHFNHPLGKLLPKLKDAKEGYYYGKQFADARSVIDHAADRLDELHRATLQWQSTWYDSTLPHWFLERTIINTGTVATANTYRFADGRFWGWEGVNACEGTCTHVWQYAQALGRLFPELERDTRERVDLGIAMRDDGGIIFRAEFETRPAIDGQAGTILRIYREHQLSPDDAFLRRNWTGIKKAVAFMLKQDKDGDGLTDTPMENTLDAVWEGEIAWIAGLCIAAAKAACEMAVEMGDAEFAAVCGDYAKKGATNMVAKLFNGEYFIHRPDSQKGKSALGSYDTCHIDQVYGQSWAHQVGLGELWDGEKTRSALRSLWKYNFTRDVGPYISTHIGGRPYALAGDGGMIMNTNPSNEPKPYGENVTWQMGYFHECMSGFEHQVASHMMAEGMTDESLVLTRMIHERYHGARRNPYNEIECSDHYARAMASYGSFISACGFTFHGPALSIGFDPRIGADHFKAPFTVAEGWGTYEQERKAGTFTASYRLTYGRLRLQKIRVRLSEAHELHKLTVRKNGMQLSAVFKKIFGSIEIGLETPVSLLEGDQLSIAMG